MDFRTLVNLPLRILIKSAIEHLVIWTFPLFHTFPPNRVRPPLSAFDFENNLLSWTQRITLWSPDYL